MSRNTESLASAFHRLQNDYDAARSTRWQRVRRGLAPGGGGADYHVRSDADYLKIMEIARDMDRNDPLIGQAVDRAVTQVIQGGFQCDPQTTDDALDLDLWYRWQAWASDPDRVDVAGEMTWQDVEAKALRQALVDGDHWLVLTSEQAMQAFEAHRVRTPSNTKKNVVHGVLLDQFRRRQQAWICPEGIRPQDALAKVGEVTPIDIRYISCGRERRQMLQIYDPKRTSQTRGVSALAPIIEVATNFADLEFAKRVQAQIVSAFAIIRERKAGHALTQASGTAGKYGPASIESNGGSVKYLDQLTPGVEITGEPGEELKGFSPNVPNAEFFEHVKLLATMCGLPLGLPLVMFFMDAGETNFSGWRGAVDIARMHFQHTQNWLRRRLHAHVWPWWLDIEADRDRAIAKRRDVLGDRFYSVLWNAPRWRYIQPQQDAEADEKRIRSHLTSPRRVAHEHGLDIDEVMDETISDYGRAIRRAILEAKAIVSETGETVDWREVLDLQSREQRLAAIPAKDDKQAQEGGRDGD